MFFGDFGNQRVTFLLCTEISLYLDYYPAIRNPETMAMSRREYLGIYIYAHPKNEIERNFNIEMLSKAEAIRCIRVTS